MAGTKNFFYWEERRASSILEYGEDAPVSLHIMGNIKELKKLMGLIADAIQWAEDPQCITGYGEDDIDGEYVLIEAYRDGVRIKPDPLSHNPFEQGWM